MGPLREVTSGQAKAMFFSDVIIASVSFPKAYLIGNTPVDLGASFRVKGERLVEPKEVRLSLRTDGQPIAVKSLELEAEVDGKLLKVGTMERHAAGLGGRFPSRSLVLQLSFQTYKTIVEGKAVTFRLGSTQLLLGDEQREGLRDLYSLAAQPPTKKF
jgi:hypothetical protein